MIIYCNHGFLCCCFKRSNAFLFPQRLYEKNKLDYHHHHHHHHHQLFSSATSTSVINQSEQQGSFLSSGAGAPTLTLNPLGPPQPHHHHPMHHHHLAQAQKPSDHVRGVGQEGLPSSGMAAFRQQPPPMKVRDRS